MSENLGIEQEVQDFYWDCLNKGFDVLESVIASLHFKAILYNREKKMDKLPKDWSEMSFTKEQWEGFKKAQKEASEKEGKDGVFEYMGEKFHVGFAKYFIQHHDHKFRD